MAPIDDPLLARARGAYELGRLRAASRVGWVVAPVALIAAPVGGQPAFTASMAVALFMVAGALLWRGQEYGQAVVTGMLAGAAPLLLALFMRGAGHECQREFCFSANIPMVVAGGLVAGAAVALRAARLAARRLAFVLSGCLIAGITGSLACIFSGLAGLVGMSIGVVAGSAPVFVWGSLRR
jgi:hypothetical protein